MKKSTWVIIAIAAAAPLAWGAISLRNAQTCSNLEEDYLNAMSHLKNAVQTKTLMTQLGNDVSDYEYMIKVDREQIEFILTNILEKCGTRAASTANRKASEQVF